jgi:hypothetical protein
MPPSTVHTCPVTYLAFGEARNAITSPTSAGSPRRPSGTFAISSAVTDSGSCAVISVAMYPGHTAFTVMPRDASSRASALVSPSSPALEAA